MKDVIENAGKKNADSLLQPFVTALSHNVEVERGLLGVQESATKKVYFLSNSLDSALVLSTGGSI